MLIVGSAPPDFETDDAIQTVTMSCHQASTRDNSNTITIQIENVDEVCEITWANTLYDIDENSIQNTPVIDAVDVTGFFPETPANPKYSINHVDPGPDDLFIITPSDGSIVIGATTPNYEVHGPIQTIYVDCMQDPGLDGVYTIDVNINEINEAPILTNMPIELTLSESIGAAVSIFRVLHYDEEGDDITVSVISRNPTTPVFTVVDNDIFTPTGLDYDGGSQTFTLDLSISDGTTSSSTETLRINLRNVIDEPPSFGLATYAASIDDGSNPGTSITWTTLDPIGDVTDNDIDDTLFYYLTGTNADHFICDVLSGEIKATQAIEDDGTSGIGTYSLQLSVKDLAGYSASAAITITVNDVNDNSPIFTPSIYVDSLPENTVQGVTVVSLTVSDQDSGAFGTLSLTIDSGDGGKFELPGNDVHLVTTNDPLDYEASDSYTLIILATDGGGLEGTATVIIHVSPVNEFAPTFTSFPSSAITIPENTDLGFELVPAASILASDGDDGKDGEITFSITSVTGGSSNLFHMDPDNGQITTMGIFDYESGTTSYTLTCQVKDGGTPIPSSTTFSLTVNIDNYNDDSPTFQENLYEVTVTEGDSVDTVVQTFVIMDMDSSSFTYQFLSGNNLGKFKLDDATNTIKINSVINLDSNDPASYLLIVQVKDGGSPELSGVTTVLVTVTSSNDHTPIFASTTPSTIEVSESDAIGTSVAIINFSDDDIGSDGDITMNIQNGDTYDNFRLDPSTGLLELKSAVHFEETGSSITLTIRATDGGTPSKTATEDITITVNDENDNKPTCVPMTYAESIGETLAASSSVAQLNCNDLDTAGLTYRIKSGDPTNNFEIDNTGLVTIATGSAIDYESGTVVYSLVIEIDDGDNQLDVPLTVNIDAVNEDTPTFTPSTWTESIDEDTPIGDVISSLATSVTDLDKGGHGITEYKINSVVPSSASSWFNVDKMTGDVYLAKVLDHESQTTYTIEVEAEDGGGLTGTASITVDINDINDNSPSCSQSEYVRNVNENTYPYVAVSMIDLACTDDDSGILGTAGLSFDLMSQSPPHEFEVSAQGISLTADTLDFESINTQYSLSLRVSDGGVPPRTTDISIFVTVDPVDDGPPVFTGPYSVTVDEDTSIGTSIEKCSAVDPDSDTTSDGEVIYSITNGDVAGVFKIELSTGIVRIIKPLDRETTGAYTLQITATDGNGGTDTETLTINVLDDNDNVPICSNSTFSLTIDENVLPPIIYSLACSDADQSDSSLNYVITKGDTSIFALNINEDVYIQQAFDYDVAGVPRSYELEITVTDSASQTAMVRGTVLVQPVNEDTPTFVPSNAYAVDVPEDVVPGTVVATITADDTDSPDTPDGVVEYKFDASCNCPEFQLDKYTGEIVLVLPLDYESVTSYSLPIIASDDSNAATGSISVNVQDANDNSPVFDSSLYTASIQEGVSVGVSVATVTVTDQDSGTDDNNVIALSITDGNLGSKFAIDSSSGDITTSGPIDYEITEEFVLEITAMDRNGVAGNTAKTTVIVKVDPVNEAPPVFQSTPYSINVDESTTPGSSLFQVVTTDLDTNSHPHGQAKYSITGGNGDMRFSLDESTGVMNLIGKLDYESVGSYTIEVTATDSTVALGDQLSTITNIVITVDDANDNAPICLSQPYAVVIAEDEVIGKTIETLTIQDADSGTNAEYDIAINNGDPNNDFLLNGDEVVIAKQLDYNTNPMYELIFSVTDRGTPMQSTKCVMTVTVSPVNTYPPVFTTESDAVTWSETTELGTHIYTALATDSDGVGKHGQVTYKITNVNEDGVFSIDQNSGIVVLRGQLDREVTDQFILEIMAFDDGDTVETTLNDTMTLTVTVADENDNNPVFSQKFYEASIDENVNVGSFVLQVSTSDADIGNNAVISYSVVGAVSDFSVDSTTGDITTAADIDRETKDYYSFVIEAKDGGTPTRSSSSVVQITVNDINDNYPLLRQQQNADIYVSEDSVSDSIVTTMWTSDADSGDNANVSFSLIDGDPLDQFYIDPWLGTIHVSNIGLDREVQNEYELVITTSDQGVPSLTSTSTRTVSISDINDNSPIIDPASYDISVDEDIYVRSTVCEISATDPDTSNNAKLTFEIKSGNDLGYFDIDSSSGLVILMRTLNVTVIDFFSLVVSVRDNGLTPLDSEAVVNVTVLDVNDNAPEFIPEAFTFYLMENVQLSTSVGTVSAIDLDFGLNSLLNYTIAGGAYFSHFAMEIDTGEMVTAAEIDRELVNTYTLTCKVKDNGTPPKYDLATLTIIVGDENDNNPIFTEDPYQVTIDENLGIGAFILSVIATDADNGTNAEISYGIPVSLNHQYFTIDTNTGEITLQDPPDFETVETIEFGILAYDGGNPPRTGTSMVRVDLIDINDNRPEFEPPFYSAELAYSITHDDPIVTVTATDRDANHNVSYFLTEESDLFELDDGSGDVRLEKGGNPENSHTYVLRVGAVDDGSPTLTSRDCLIRIDTFNPSNHLVDFYMSISRDNFTITQEEFKEAVTNITKSDFPLGRCDVSHVTTRGTTTSRTSSRKLLANDEESIIVHVYGVEDNTTDSKDNLNDTKEFMTSSYLFDKFTSDSDGTPSEELQGSVFDQWNIEKVVLYDPRTPWWQIWWGMLLIGLLCLAILISCIVITVCIYCLCCRHKRQKTISPSIGREQTPQRKETWLPKPEPVVRPTNPTESLFLSPKRRRDDLLLTESLRTNTTRGTSTRGDTSRDDTQRASTTRGAAIQDDAKSNYGLKSVAESRRWRSPQELIRNAAQEDTAKPTRTFTLDRSQLDRF
ncbi:protocadherin Fat 4-like isoform X2 [Glandiceps talaboti]